MICHAARVLVLAGAGAASLLVAAPSADAGSRYDGRWSAVLMTRSGPCDPAYRGAVQVVNGILAVEGDSNGALTGRVAPNGAVVARGTLGPNYGIASGRLSGNTGGGTWRVRLQNGECSGVWTAQRLMAR